jgi:hypothetical protein
MARRSIVLDWYYIAGDEKYAVNHETDFEGKFEDGSLLSCWHNIKEASFLVLG